MAVETDHVQKLLRIVGSDRTKHSAQEVCEAEAELLTLGVQGHERFASRLAGWAPVALVALAVCLLAVTQSGRIAVRRVPLAPQSLQAPRAARAAQIPRSVASVWQAPPRAGRVAPTSYACGDFRVSATASRADLLKYAQDVAKISRAPSLISPPQGLRATRADWQKFIAARNEQPPVSYSSQDPQVSCLAELGRDHLDILLDPSLVGSFYLHWALPYCVRRSDKDQVLRAFKRDYDLADLILKFGWAPEARQTLVSGMSDDRSSYPAEFVKLVASLREPETFPHLLKYLANGVGPSGTYEAVKDIPGLNCREALDTAWRRVAKQNDWDTEALGSILLEFGYSDALEVLMRVLANEKDLRARVNDWYGNKTRAAILDHIDFLGSDSEIVLWYSKNRNKLRFDDRRKKFTTMP